MTWRPIRESERTFEGLHGRRETTECVSCDTFPHPRPPVYIATHENGEVIEDEEYGTPCALCALCAYSIAELLAADAVAKRGCNTCGAPPGCRCVDVTGNPVATTHATRGRDLAVSGPAVPNPAE